jgi:transcriptional regulator with XRE-family HTH domain
VQISSSWTLRGAVDPADASRLVTDDEEIRRRIRAARAYAGYSLDELADRVGFGRQTLVRIEQGERQAKRMELREIAVVCGLPYEFFTSDFDQLRGDRSDLELDLDVVRDVAEMLVTAADRVRERLGLPAVDEEEERRHQAAERAAEEAQKARQLPGARRESG